MHPRELLTRAGLAATMTPARLSGGDMGDVWQVGDLVVKTHLAPPPGLYMSEAQGLTALAHAGARTPTVHYADNDGLVISYLEPGRDDFGALGQQVAHLHRQSFENYGWAGPTFIGRFALPVSTQSPDWYRFWREQRIEPLLKVCEARLGDFNTRCFALLDTYRPPTEGPALLHGDLWSGNVLMTSAGPALIDPSVWYGERAVDLAMMKLFGGFPARFWASYEALYPIPGTVRDAIPFYQLYYLLVHVHFFGRSYLGGVDQVLRRYGH